MAYATPQHVYDLGLRAEAFQALPRKVTAVYPSVLPAAGVFELVGHGLDPEDVLTWQILGTTGGSTVPGTPSASLPGGLLLGTVYYPLPSSSDLFGVALSPNGAPVTITSAGAGEFGIRVDPTRKLLKILADQAALIDEDLTDYDPPILPDPETGEFPQVLVGLNARMAGRAAITVFGLANVKNEEFEAAAKRIEASREEDNALRARWRAGKPINVRPKDQTPARVEGAARGGYARPQHGWGVKAL